MSDTPPEVSVSPARKVFLSGASFVWIIPILALVVALAVAWRSYNDRGPLIVIEFENGAGIAAGETELRFRDITVGRVEAVGFTDGLAHVTASVRIDKDIAPYVDGSAVFWIVQPEVTAQGITGLSTVLSGVHIEGSWDDTPGGEVYRFVGATEPPLIRPGQSGLEIAFRTAANGQLTDNAPILFKGIEVGRVGRAKIAPQGNYAIVEALIYDEHRSLISGSTRFWDASGFSLNIGPAGAEIDFSSLATLVGGGVTFDTFVSGGEPVQDGTVFEIFPDKETARNSVFNASAVDPLQIAVVFDDNISGLTVGAPVELSGLKIGEVDTLSGVVNYDQYGDSRVRLNVSLSIQPARLGLPGEVTAATALEFLKEQVEGGLRARLASASLLTGGLKVELIDVPDAPPAELVAPSDTALPVMPTTESETSDAAATVEGVFNRINGLPIEELLNSAIAFLNSADALVSDPNVRGTPQDVRTLLGDVSALLTSEDIRNIPVSLNATLTRVEELVAQLEEQRLAERLVEAVDVVAETAATVTTSIEGVPGLIEDVRAVAVKARDLQVEELIAEVTELLNSADAVISAEDTVALPTELRTAVANVSSLLTELRDGGTLDNINQTLASTRTAADNIAQTTQSFPELLERLYATLDSAAAAADSVTSSVAGVPELIDQIQAVAAKAESLELQELLDQLTQVTRSADAILASEDTLALPADLRDAINGVSGVVQELRDGGAVRDINQTLASARSAASNIAQTTQNLPELTERLYAAIDSAAAAADSVTSSVAGVPELVQQIQDVAAKAESLEVEQLLTELTTLTRSVDAVVGTDDAIALPGSLNRALEQINLTIAELREGGTVANVNETLASARNAADSIATVTVEDLPRIIERLNTLFTQAGTTIAGYDSGQQLTRATQDTLRDIQKAADALASLARAIERNPNSLLLGR